jgi:hypothetical protein
MRDVIKPARLAAATLALMCATSAAFAQTAATPKPHTDHTPCFFISQWEGWKAPNDHTLYLAVNFHEVYQVDLAGGSSLLQDPDARLVNITHGPDSVCSPLDLQLAVATFGGMREPLIATHLSKLTKEQVAEIPKKYRPY